MPSCCSARPVAPVEGGDSAVAAATAVVAMEVVMAVGAAVAAVQPADTIRPQQPMLCWKE